MKAGAWSWILAVPLTGLLYAHDPGLSTANLRFKDGSLEASLTYAMADIEGLVRLDGDRDGKVSRAEFDAARPQLEGLAHSAVEIRAITSHVPGQVVAIEFDESAAVHFRLNFATGSDSRIGLRSSLLSSLPHGHRQYLSAVDARGNLVGRQMLSKDADLFETEWAPAATAPKEEFGHFLLLGIEHILTGYDHLVFLLALLLAGGSFLSAGKIITSFTLAHSITLALATLNWVRLPASLVEPLIAVSIIYVGVENIFRRELKRRWLLTFGFGLVHGFGFASVLRELGVGFSGGGVLMPLFSFNFGVELGQVALAAVAFPLISRLRNSPAFVVRYVPAGSVLVIIAGGYWFIDRIFLN